MIRMPMREQGRVEAVEAVPKGTLAEVSRYVKNDGVTIITQPHSGAVALVARIRRGADLATAANDGDPVRCTRTQESDAHAKNVVRRGRKITVGAVTVVTTGFRARR